MPRNSITYTDLLNNVHYRPNDIDTREVLQLLKQAKAVPQQLLPFKGIIHVIDYIQRRHVAISGPVKNMIGHDPREVMDSGLDFVMDIFHKDDFKIYNETIFREVADFLQKTDQCEHGEYIFSYAYRMRKADGSWLHLFQQGSYITDPKTNLPVYGIGVVTDITPIKRDTSMIFSIDKKASNGSFLNYQNIRTDYYYSDPSESKISKREKEILNWLADGLSSKEIARKLFLSESTVVNHRKKMLKKTNTKNIAELIRYSISRGII